MKRILLPLLAVCLLSNLGCAGAQAKTDSTVSEKKAPIAGKYYNQLSTVIYLDLKEDGTFDDRFGKRSTKGKYAVDGNHVTFTYENGKSFECTIEGKYLIYKDGSRYVKQ